MISIIIIEIRDTELIATIQYCKQDLHKWMLDYKD